MPDKPIVLLTGFGPFPNVPANATSFLVPKIAEVASDAFAGVRIECHIIATEWGAGLFHVSQLYRHLRPSLAVHFGVSRRASGFEVETRARNFCSQSKDAAGFMPDGARVSPYGPDYMMSTLPTSHIVSRLRRRGIPASLSRDAGGYLCNALLYRAQELARESAVPMRSGFIHLPSTLINERNPSRGPLGSCALGWRDVVDGGLEAIAASLGQPTPVVRRPVRV